MTNIDRLDEVFGVIYAHRTAFTPTDIQNILNREALANKSVQRDKLPFPSLEELVILIRQLKKDDYIEDVSSGLLRITYKGILFYEYGGYKKDYELQKVREEKERQRQEMEERQIKSVIDTNASVQATNTLSGQMMQRQVRLTWVSIIVAGASALFALGSILVDWSDTTSDELKQINSRQEKQIQVLERMLQAQKGIDSTFRHVADTAQ